jgi:phosphatidylserine decarboxylase
VRTTPRGANLIVAPADGLVTMIAKVPAPPELREADGLGEGEYTRVSIFMSVFDVHINRSPIAGRIKRIAYIPGKFLNADLDKASEDNERQHFLVEGAGGLKIGFTQIAGLVARRILSFVREGDSVAAGERVGLIRFGSRVDVYLPSGTGPRILLGQRSIAGETVLGEVGIDPGLSGLSQ